MANRIVRLKKIPKEVVATELTVERAWGRNEDLIAIYEFGRDWNHCIKFLKRAPPPKIPHSAPPPHPSSKGNPIVCTLGNGHPRIEHCSMIQEKAAFHTFGAKTWDRVLINKRLASMEMGRKEWKGALWKMEDGEVSAQKRFEAWIGRLGNWEEDFPWWEDGNVERWCRKNVDKGQLGDECTEKEYQEDWSASESASEGDEEPVLPRWDPDEVYWEMEQEFAKNAPKMKADLARRREEERDEREGKRARIEEREGERQEERA